MERARSGILQAAAELIGEHGVPGITMVGVARRAGVAKATVYNHVRDRDELLTLVLLDQWATVQRLCHEQPRDQRLATAAAWASDSIVVAGLRRHSPEVLVALAGAALSDPQVTDVVRGWIPEQRDPEAALRWLMSFLLAPR